MTLAPRTDRGYAMAALLVAMSVMAVLMGALLPQWSTMAKREREEELIFRGNQYARAVGLFQRKFANTAPPTIDVLVEQRFLRKKYKDPITGDDFQPLYANQQEPQFGGGSQVAARPGEQANARLNIPARGVILPGPNNPGFVARGGIIGVTSKSKDTSIKVYNGRTRYNEWAFVYVQTSQRPGLSVGAPGQGGPGGRGGPGQQGPGQQPFGMNPANMPGGRGGFQQPPSGFGTPNRPPVGSPMQGPQGLPQNPGSTTPGQRRPGGQ